MKRPWGEKRIIHAWQRLIRIISRRVQKDAEQGKPTHWTLGPVQILPPYSITQPPPIP